MKLPQFIETHCHLDSLKEKSIDETVAAAAAVGVDKIITIAVNPQNLESVCQIAMQFENVYTTQGVHPHDAKNFSVEVLSQIQKNALKHKKVVAIGEIGLDYHYNFSTPEEQKEVFDQQLQLAVQLNLPVVIHSREADDDMIFFLEKYGPLLTRKGVLHSFSSTLKLAEVAIKQGFSLGFNGIITFKTADLVREALKITPLHQLVLETDSPYLAPTPHRGKENNPSFIPLIAQKAYAIRGGENKKNEEDFYQTIYHNSTALFNLV